MIMSQSTRNYESTCCKGSPLPDAQCRLTQWATSPDENLSSSSSSDPSTRFAQPVSSLTTADKLERHPYRDPEKLRAIYEQAGTIAGTAAHFDVSHTTTRLWLIQYEMYDPERQGLSSIANRLEKLSPEDLGLSPLGDH